MRPLALAVEQLDAALDPGPALAGLPAARRFVLRPPALATLPPPPGAEALTATWRGRVEAAALVHREVPTAVVVVLHGDERVSAELGRALAALCQSDATGTFVARRMQHFLGRAVADGTLPIAWRGAPEAAARGEMLDGFLTRMTGDVAQTIATMDREATRHAQARAGRRGAFSIAPACGLARRLWRRRRDGIPGLVLSVVETYGEVLAAAKGRERLATAAGSQLGRGRGDVPPGFTVAATPEGWILVREGWGERLARVVREAAPDHVEGEALHGAGRGAAWLVPLAAPGPRAVLRWYRRGGALRHLLRDRYFGWRWRPVRELVLTEEARRRGVAAAEVLAVRVDRLGGGFYRGALVTREIEDAETLAEALRRRPTGAERARLIVAVAHALRGMHDRGVHHRDLNASNLLIRRNGAMDVHFVDFDRARVRAVVGARARRRALRRLARSLAKLDPARELLAADDCVAFHHAYWEASAGAPTAEPTCG